MAPVEGETIMKKKNEDLAMNRRDFLKAGVVTTGAAVALGGSGSILGGTAAEPVSAESTNDLASLKDADVRLFPNMITPNRCVIHDPNVCIGCNTCVQVCHQDVMVPNPVKGKPPIVMWPDECFPCGICVQNCPLGLDAKAITLNQPLCQRARWKRKATGEHFRIGMKNPPPPNNLPPVGGWSPRS
jgi:ferredoxin